MKISVVTPTIREDGLGIVKTCLDRQVFKDFEWLVVSPSWDHLWLIIDKDNYNHVPEPAKRDGDNYALNKAWNAAFRQAKGDLIVSIVDLLWFPPDVLEKLWNHYQTNPFSCIGGIGHQYNQVVNGKPETMVWRDPRMREQSFYEVSPMDYELCLASIPRKAILGVGGVEEEFDKYAALSEKEMCMRIVRLGYKFFIDQTIEYRAIKHDRLTKDWDERYQKGIVYFNECLKSIQEGKRLKLDHLVDSS